MIVRPGAPSFTSSSSSSVPCYPAPLRLREYSDRHTDSSVGDYYCYSPRSGHSSSVTTNTTAATTISSPCPSSTAPSTLRSSGEYAEHPDYPHLSPYSPAEVRARSSSRTTTSSASSWLSPDEDDEEPRLPRTPAFMWRGYDDCVVYGPGPGPDGTLEYPACLRPGGGIGGVGRGVSGGGGPGCRLDGPFVAELA